MLRGHATSDYQSYSYSLGTFVLFVPLFSFFLPTDLNLGVAGVAFS